MVSVGYRGRSRLIVMSFGKNPVSGGIPLIDRIIRGAIVDIMLMLEHIFCSWG
jgi:hypothetical protein